MTAVDTLRFRLIESNCTRKSAINCSEIIEASFNKGDKKANKMQPALEIVHFHLVWPSWQYVLEKAMMVGQVAIDPSNTVHAVNPLVMI